MQTKSANNFGVNIQTLKGPSHPDHLASHQKVGHDIATFNTHTLMAEGSKELLMAAMVFRDLAREEGLAVDVAYNWSIRKDLTVEELTKKVQSEAKAWQEGLEQYLWIAADVCNAQTIEARYTEKGRKARDFQDISKRMGHDLTPFWEFQYQEWTGREYAPDDRTLETIQGNILEPTTNK